jgi:hypothetical protein
VGQAGAYLHPGFSHLCSIIRHTSPTEQFNPSSSSPPTTWEPSASIHHDAPFGLLTPTIGALATSPVSSHDLDLGAADGNGAAVSIVERRSVSDKLVAPSKLPIFQVSGAEPVVLLLLHSKFLLLEVDAHSSVGDGGRGNRIIVVSTKMTADGEKGCQPSTVDGAADLATKVILSDLLLFFTISKVGGPDLHESRPAGHGEIGPDASLGFSRRASDVVASVVGGEDGTSCVVDFGVGRVGSYVVDAVLATDGALGVGRGREGRGNKGDEGNDRCELHGGKFGKRLFNSWSGILFKLDCFRNCEKQKGGADIEMCDIGGAESTPTLTLKLPFDSHHTKSVGNVFSLK